MDAFAQRVLSSSTFTHSLASFIKNRMNKSMDEWRLTAKKNTHHTGIKVCPTAPEPPTESFSSEGFPVSTDREVERAHTRGHK